MEFSKVNDDVHSILMEAMKSTEGETIVARFHKGAGTRNARAAYQAFGVTHFQSAMYNQGLVLKGTQMLAKVFYAGPKKGYTLGDYFKMHSEAHIMLKRGQQPLPEAQKISHFMLNLQDPETIVM